MEDRLNEYFNNIKNVRKLATLLKEWHESEIVFSKRHLEDDSIPFTTTEIEILLDYLEARKENIRRS